MKRARAKIAPEPPKTHAAPHTLQGQLYQGSFEGASFAVHNNHQHRHHHHHHHATDVCEMRLRELEAASEKKNED